ncbi:hypothetical protein LCGC14_0568280 [marine sediment metagenome]|uniref:Portal protein n=1 Tax=marine sediment metagenome TaxID=412755 RepID=A0A0F9U6E4_9ZZZZ
MPPTVNRQRGNNPASTDADVLKEGIIEQRKSASFKMKDEDLIITANAWIDEAKPLHNEYLKLQKRNERYFLGNQLDRKRLGRYRAHIVLNKVFQSLETVIPRATRKLPAPMVSLPQTDDEEKEKDSRKYSENLEKIMLSIATGMQIPQILKQFLRFHELFYLGVLKFGYDKEEGIWVKNIRAQRILIPPYDDDYYVIEYHENTLGELKARFPKKAKEIEELVVTKGQKKNAVTGSRIGYYEITTDEFKFWKVNNLVLKKVKNPHWDEKNSKKNHWKTPKKDYIFSDLWTLGVTSYSLTTLVDQMITLQDSINKRKRQISDNADHANGQIVVYGNSGFTKKEAAALEENRKRANSVTYTKDGAQGGVQNFQGQQLQPYVMEDMLHTIAEVDNVFGTHSTTRGEKTPGEETFGGRQLLKESDQERIEELAQMLERVMEKVYNAFAQMIRVHFKKKEYISFLGTDGTATQIPVDKAVVRDGTAVDVRQGSSLTKDKVALSQEAIVLWQQKAIDPITLFERLGDPTPFRTAERLVKWTTNPQALFADAMAEVKEQDENAEAEDTKKAIAQAEIENRSLIKGANVPPFEGANPQHIAVHQDLFNTPRFKELDIKIREKAADHLEAELEIVKTKTAERKEAGAAEAELPGQLPIPGVAPPASVANV